MAASAAPGLIRLPTPTFNAVCITTSSSIFTRKTRDSDDDQALSWACRARVRACRRPGCAEYEHVRQHQQRRRDVRRGELCLLPAAAEHSVGCSERGWHVERIATVLRRYRAECELLEPEYCAVGEPGNRDREWNLDRGDKRRYFPAGDGAELDEWDGPGDDDAVAADFAAD